jgi:hypothetical protein
MNWYLLGLVGALMALAIQRFILAIKIKDDPGRDHCEKVFAVLVVALCVLFACPAKAQSDHMRWHTYYRHWKQPGQPMLSCCNAREIGPNGEDLTGDCEPTRAEIRDGDWWAWLRQESRWIKVPDSKIIRERNPAGEEAHLCATKSLTGAGWAWTILCFVPPDTGG